MASIIIQKSKADKRFDVLNLFVMSLLLLIMLYPLYFTVIASVSDPYKVVSGKVYLWPEGFTLDAYRYVFNDARVWRGYGNTIFYTVFGTLFNLFLTLPCAYVMSKKDLVGRNLFSLFFLVSMYFGGGLIPTYLQVKAYGLLNKSYTLIVLGGISVYNMVVTRVYYQTAIPNELYESASIDGLSDFGKFVRIAIPLSAPIIAVMALYYAVSHWNSYFSALIYTSDTSLQPLQIVLRNIPLLNQAALNDVVETTDAEALADAARRSYLAESMKYALIFVASAPLLIAYPFVQKHFVKGMMIGAVKG